MVLLPVRGGRGLHQGKDPDQAERFWGAMASPKAVVGALTPSLAVITPELVC